MRRSLATILVAAVTALTAAAAFALEPQLVNRSHSVACAEVDNVDFRFSAGAPLAFTIEATFPSYFHAEMEDRTAPVWDNCEGYDANDPVFTSTPAERVLYEDDDWLLVGIRKPSFWRPAIVPVRVDGERFSELHLLQLHRKREVGETVEVLVLYPPDGYWRPKPLAPVGHAERAGRDTAFGSSFLIGPIEEDGRPLVDLAEVTFVPEAARFELRFLRGGSATLEVAEVAVDGLTLEVRIDREESEAEEVAAVRSMFVEPTMADTALLRWSGGDGAAGETEVMGPFDRTVAEATFAREVPSEHNTSAPDLRFFDFRPLAEAR
ncbi:MAG: hypothetical protein GVY33_02495 [Alphaproteobacteria bacterium]|jgi:hypothetical protein|nr:hypothetical protein [Alphaproteobacteria bacterium]